MRNQPETLRRAHAVHPVTTAQTEYSLWSREVEAEVLPICRDLGIGFVPYSPLGRGFLTGRFQNGTDFEDGDFRASLPRFQSDAVAVNRHIADLIGRIAARKGCSSAQLALAWLLAQGDDIVPIPGTKRIANLRDSTDAVNVTLSETDLREIRQGLGALPVSGARYTEERMRRDPRHFSAVANHRLEAVRLALFGLSQRRRLLRLPEPAEQRIGSSSIEEA